MKEFLHDMNDDLLVKYLLDEASAKERRIVEEWIDSDTANSRYFDHFRLIWEKSQELAAVSTVNEDQAWKRFQQRIGAAPKEEAKVIRFARNTRWMRVAAIFLISLTALGIIWMVARPGKDITPTELTVASTNASKTETLPDGSVVVLNKNSSLSFASAFTGSNRPVQLKGEAFFNIKPNKKKPFVVHINDVTITVLGTSFNVKNVNGKTEVVVETGLVQVSRASKTVQLKPKEKITVSSQDSVLTKEQVTDKLYNYYRTRQFPCDQTPLWKLVEVLNEAYNEKIVIERPALKGLLLTTTFDDEPIDRILEVIVATFNDEHIQIERKDSLIILK